MLLIVVLAFGLFLRTFNLRNEVAWFDELLTIPYLEASSLPDFLEAIRWRNPSQPPLYMILQYGWSRVFGPSEGSVRAMSILAGMLSLGMMFLIAKKLFGTRAGLIATLWMAFIPFHIYHAQEARFYAFVTLFALVSMYAFLAICRGAPVRWWGLWGAANLALIWTHPLSATLFTAQAFYLCVFFRDRVKILAVGLAQHVLVTATLLPWILVMNHEGGEEVLAWLKAPNVFLPGPSFERFVRMAAGELNRLPTNRVGAALIDLKPVLTGVLVLSFLSAIVFLIVSAWPRRSESESHDAPQKRHGHAVWFLLIWFLVPPVTSFFFSHTLRPIFQARYLIFASLPLYPLIAGALVTLKPKVFRYVFPVLLAFNLTYQAVYHIPGPFRYRYDRAAEIILESERDGDRIAYHWYGDLHAMRHYLGDSPIESKIIQRRRDYLEELAGERSENRARWYLMTGKGFVAKSIDQLEAEGTPYTRYDLSTGRQLVLIQLDP